jgi:hypothetical protein
MVIKKKLNCGHRDRSFWKEHGGLSYNNRKKFNKSLNILLREKDIQFIHNKIDIINKKVLDIDQFHCGENVWIMKSLELKKELKMLHKKEIIYKNQIRKIKSGEIDLGVGGCTLV